MHHEGMLRSWHSVQGLVSIRFSMHERRVGERLRDRHSSGAILGHYRMYFVHLIHSLSTSSLFSRLVLFLVYQK